MFILPLLLIAFVVILVVAWRHTNDVWESFALAGGLVAMPIGAFLGGFWGFLLGGVIGALIASLIPLAVAMIPLIAAFGVIYVVVYGLFAAVIYGLGAVGSLLGLSDVQTFFAFMGSLFLLRVITMPISRNNPQSLLDEVLSRSPSESR